MDEENAIEIKLRLSKAKTYEHMMWLGLLFLPLVFVFFAMSRGQIREAEVYNLNEEEERTAKNIKSSTRNILIALIGIWIFAVATLIFLYYNALESTSSIYTGRYRY